MLRLSTFPQSLIVTTFALSLIWPQFAAAETLSRGPYLQNANTQEVTVRWRSAGAADSVVRYGTSPGALTQSVSLSASVTEHEIRLTGLSANTKYYYSVGSNANTLASGSEYYFVTAPNGAKPTRVWVIGDAGTANSVQTSVRDAYYAFNGTQGTDLWLMLGDNAYSSGTDAQYQSAVFNIYGDLLRNSVVWSTLGNHDAASASSSTLTGPYYDIFTFPRQGEAGGVASGTEAYYSFEYGNIHFVCLNSQDVSRSTSGAMLTWLQADLQANSKDWLIAFFHHPPYSKGSHNSDTETQLIEMRQNALPLLESYGVDLVLAGHSHAYERSFLLDGHYGTSGTLSAAMKLDAGSGREDGDGAYVKAEIGPNPNDGAVYVVAGASGQTSGGSLNHPAMYISLNVAGSLVVDIDDARLDGKYLNSAGNIADYFTIVKGAAGNALPTVSLTSPSQGATFTAPASIALAASASDSDGSVTKVDFYAGGTLLGTDTTAPYTFSWSNVASGNYALTAKATDNEGGEKTSAPVSIAVTTSGGPTTLALQNGLNGYSGMVDASLRSDNATTNYGGATTLLADGKPDYSSVMRWDLSAIPTSATLVSASLTFYVEDPSSSSYELYALKRNFDESSVTWSNASTSTSWQVAGANGSNDRETTMIGAITGSSTGTKTIALNAAGLAKVQAWIANPAVNYGLILLDYTPSNGLDLSSSESTTASRRPLLSVTYN
jgi:hypothetical protein